MTNARDRRFPGQSCISVRFGLRHSAFLRHSGFVIRHFPVPPSDEFRRRFFRRRGEATAAGSAAEPFRRTAKSARVEAVLFVADGPLSARRLAQLATLADAAEARAIIGELNESYDAGGSAFRVERVAAGWQLLTRPVFAAWLSRIHQRQAELKLSPPAMETLTIVAYRQPVTRADVESIRGVQCAEMLKQLMDRDLVRIAGEDDSLGRPYLYETTRRFLELFGLRSLDDLPLVGQLRRNTGAPPEPAAENPSPEVSAKAS